MNNIDGFQPGQALDAAALFKEGDLVDVQGTSIGKGFAGGIKRWNMHRGLMSHGSKSHRGPGSIGMRYSGDGGRVMPGMRMPGHLGAETVTVRKLTVLKVDVEKRAIVIHGSVPGKAGNVVSGAEEGGDYVVKLVSRMKKRAHDHVLVFLFSIPRRSASPPRRLWERTTRSRALIDSYVTRISVCENRRLESTWKSMSPGRVNGNHGVHKSL